MKNTDYLNDEKTYKRWLWLVNDRLIVKDAMQPFSLPPKLMLPHLQLNPLVVLNDNGTLLINATGLLSAAQLTAKGIQLMSMRELLLSTSADHHPSLVRAFHLLTWQKLSKFCGQCGSALTGDWDNTERHCASCKQSFFPRFSPAMMVLIKKDNAILLAHSSRHKAKVYSALAGFVEPGETVEQCVHREVMEEVGLRIKNLRYFGSQPWPFPDCLMIAFTAEYDSGDIVLDDDEIIDANWFTKESLPLLPNTASIARQLIEHALAETDSVE